MSNFNTVTLDWGAATDAESGVQSYGLFRDNGSGPVEVATVQNADATAPAPTHYVDQNLEPAPTRTRSGPRTPPTTTAR